MDIDTGCVEVQAEARPPGRGAKCAVCREVLSSGEPHVWVQPHKNKASRFFMHPGCSGRVLFRLMMAFNKITDGNGNGGVPENVKPRLESEPGKQAGPFTWVPPE